MEKERRDFFEKLKKSGRIKDVSEAFKEFPPEEEWHKGDPNSFLFEETEKYGEYEIGDIIFVKEFQYSNGFKGTNHLFVIIERDNYAVPIEYFAMLISSHTEKLKFSSNKLLIKNQLNNLNRNSIVKIDEIYKIESEHILFKIGRVEKETIEEYMKNLEKLF